MGGIDVGMLRRLWPAFAGTRFNGKRDYYDAFGYKKILTYEDLRAKYERQDITQRIVDEPVTAIWDYPPELNIVPFAADFNGELPENADFVAQLREIAQKMRLWQQFARADKLCAFGRFSVLVLGLPGSFSAPLRQASLEDLRYIQPFPDPCVQVSKWDRDQTSPRFGRPLEYEINFNVADIIPEQLAGATSLRKADQRKIPVHWTRVIHVVDNPLENDLLGIPRVQVIHNLLDDLLKTAGGTAEVFWNTGNRGMQVNVDKDMEMQPEDEKALSDELDEFQHNLRRYIRTRGVEIKNLGSDVADPRGTFEVLVSLLAGATGIPQRILMGAEAGQLASEQDRANWAVVIDKRRKHFAMPSIILPFVERMQMLGAFPEGMLIADWPDAFHQNPLEKAQTMAQFARAAANLSGQGRFDGSVTTLEEARRAMGLRKKPAKGEKMFKPPKQPTGGTPGGQSVGGNDNVGTKPGNTGSSSAGGNA